jgi:hypothetical protein
MNCEIDLRPTEVTITDELVGVFDLGDILMFLFTCTHVFCETCVSVVDVLSQTFHGSSE